MSEQGHFEKFLAENSARANLEKEQETHEDDRARLLESIDATKSFEELFAKLAELGTIESPSSGKVYDYESLKNFIGSAREHIAPVFKNYFESSHGERLTEELALETGFFDMITNAYNLRDTVVHLCIQQYTLPEAFSLSKDEFEKILGEKPQTITEMKAFVKKAEIALDDFRKKLLVYHESETGNTKEQSAYYTNLRLKISLLDKKNQEIKSDLEFLEQGETSFIEKPE